MKLYHATDQSNVEYILESGLTPTDAGNKLTTGPTLQGNDLYGVFGFANLDDALLFADDNNFDTAIFEFDAIYKDMLIDPEYDEGQSFFVLSDDPIQANQLDIN
jgi:hypothetical protein